MNRNFEIPAKDILLDWFASRGRMPLTSDEARLVTRWLIKTLILQKHSRARLDHPRLDAESAGYRWSEPLPQSHYDWMTASTDPLPDPPRDLSLWVFRRDLDEQVPPDGRSTFTIGLPMVTEEGSAALSSASTIRRGMASDSLWSITQAGRSCTRSRVTGARCGCGRPQHRFPFASAICPWSRVVTLSAGPQD